MFAAAMDLIVAADDAKFLPNRLQYFTAPWDFGIRRAKQILFEGRVVEAAEGLELGLVSRVVPRANLDHDVMEYAATIAELGVLQLGMIKHDVNMAQDFQSFTDAVNAAHDSFLVPNNPAPKGSAAAPGEDGRPPARCGAEAEGAMQ